MRVSLLTPKCTFVPVHFFNEDRAGEILAQVFDLAPQEKVGSAPLNSYGAVAVYAASPSCLKITDPGYEGPGEGLELPELFWLAESLQKNCPEYNKILCSHVGGYLHLVIGQGNNLLLANSYPAPDFTTVMYYVFLALKSLQMNPEVSTICFARPVSSDDQMSLYRYFKAVEVCAL